MNTVLVVEDTEDLRDLFVEILRAEGYAVRAAENGQAALEILQSLPRAPCLVLLDMMMPVMDGRTFLTKLRESPRLAALPVVVVSAVANAKEMQGVRHVVKKPISPDVLTQVVRQFGGPP